MKQDKSSYDNKVVISRNYDMKSIMVQHSVPPPRYYLFAMAIYRPLYRLALLSRRGYRDYRREVKERFGKRFYRPKDNPWNNQHCDDIHINAYPHNGDSERPVPLYSVRQTSSITIWCHIISLAEDSTITALLRQLLVEGHRIWITSDSHIGIAQTKRFFATEIDSGQVQYSYKPFDSIKVVNKFLQYVRPQLALFVESQLWANTLYQCSQSNTVTMLINAQLSKKSFTKYERYSRLSHSMMANLGFVLARDSDSAKGFRILGVDSNKMSVISSLQWANVASTATKVIDKQAIKKSVGNRPIWVAGNTHRGEEEVILSAHQKLILRSKTNPLLILVPRHPERCDELIEMMKANRLSYARRSDKQAITDETNVYLVDRISELAFWYELANVAFVGGSMVNIGGHNPIEALNQGTPVIMGHYTQSLNGMLSPLIQQGCLYKLDVEYTHNKEEPLDKEVQKSLSKQLCKQLVFWLANKKLTEKISKQGQALISDEQQSMDYQLKMITKVITDLSVRCTE